MGEITREMPIEYISPDGDRPEYDGKRHKGSVKHKDYRAAEQIANNPEILERVIKNSEERGEIPTKTAVLILEFDKIERLKN